MLKEKISNLERKGYTVKRVRVAVRLPNNDLGTKREGIYFANIIYNRDRGFNTKNIPYINENPQQDAREVSTELNIDFCINLRRTKELNNIHELKSLLEKITEDITDSLKINCSTKIYTTYSYYSEAALFIYKNTKETKINIIINIGEKNFNIDTLKNQNNQLVEGTINIIKTTPITRYF